LFVCLLFAFWNLSGDLSFLRGSCCADTFFWRGCRYYPLYHRSRTSLANCASVRIGIRIRIRIKMRTILLVGQIPWTNSTSNHLFVFSLKLFIVQRLERCKCCIKFNKMRNQFISWSPISVSQWKVLGKSCQIINAICVCTLKLKI